MPTENYIRARYGAYAHDQGEVEIAVNKTLIETDAKTAFAQRVQINLAGVLLGDGIADLEQQAAALVSNYSVDGLDFIVEDQDGNALSLSLYAANCNGGTRVTRRPSFPSNRDAAYVTFLPYQITIEGDERIQGVETAFRSFQETVSFSGGGRRFGTLETRVGLPQRQLWTRNTIYRAVQEGSAVGLYAYPSVPAALWPAWQLATPDIRYTGGRLVGTGAGQVYMDFGARWRYEFESPFALFGTPNNWGS